MEYPVQIACGNVIGRDAVYKAWKENKGDIEAAIGAAEAFYRDAAADSNTHPKNMARASLIVGGMCVLQVRQMARLRIQRARWDVSLMTA